MLFTELRFVVLFAAAFGLAWGIRSNGARKTVLLLASYVFYGAWDWRFLSLILASTALDYGVGLGLGRARAPRRRRLLLVASLFGNLGMLGAFKYYDFFAGSLAALLASAGLAVSPVTLDVVLPVGISFYTFQTLSYSIDVYRGRLAPTRDLRDLALFVAFFPQLVAGPIVRASQFLPQLARRPRFGEVPVRPMLTLFLIGWVKKACIADRAAIAVDAVFAEPAAYGAADHWLGALLYAIQIYGDFSGYSDMAIACAGLLGYRLTENFHFPYLAATVTDFWRRWHISLSTWFRDYLYVPLGGNRGPRATTARNLAVVFLLCGLWHGAAWTFVLWGAWHGAFLVLERVVLGRRGGGGRRVLTLLVVLVGWVLFRSADLAGALEYLAGMVPGAATPSGAKLDPRWWAFVAACTGAHLVMADGRLARALARLPDWGYALAWGAVCALAMPWATTGHQPFIYFQF